VFPSGELVGQDVTNSEKTTSALQSLSLLLPLNRSQTISIRR